MNQILMISDGIFHPPILARRAVQNLLHDLPGFQFNQTDSLNRLPQIDLNLYSAMVLYFHHKQCSPESFALLEMFVSRGGGLLAIHSATASFEDEPQYFKILGGRFLSHGPVEAFTIYPEAGGNLFPGIKQFVVTDELYIHENEPDIVVHFSAELGGQSHPLVWTHSFGQGRVCYIGPGHKTETMKQPQIQEILQRGFLWVTGL